jgi:hypothetical protein
VRHNTKAARRTSGRNQRTQFAQAKGGIVAANHLEALVNEWYEFQGYFVREDVRVGPLPRGGFEGQLDIVAFHPEQKLLVHVEPSLDADGWPKRERRYKKRFEAGQKYIPTLFPGIPIPTQIDQIALFVFNCGRKRTHVGGGRVLYIGDFMAEVRKGIDRRKIDSAAIPEKFPLLRTLQFAAQYWSGGSNRTR